MLHGRPVGGVDFFGVVPASAHFLQLFVGKVVDHSEQFGMGTKEIPAYIVAGFNCIFLVLAVHHFVHAPDENTLVVPGQQRVPVVPPNHFDDVPAGAAECGLQFLNHLAVTAYRAVQPLEIAVDHEDEVVQLFPGGQRDCAKGIRARRFRRRL